MAGKDKREGRWVMRAVAPPPMSGRRVRGARAEGGDGAEEEAEGGRRGSRDKTLGNVST